MLLIAVIVLLILGFMYLFPLARVYGTSMLPTLKEGSILLCTRINKRELEKGNIYVFKSPNGKLAIKRLMEFEVNENLTFNCWFEGDNLAESYDSRNYGFINEENIVAKVLWKLK